MSLPTSHRRYAQPGDWEAQKHTIHGLYVVEDKPLKEVMVIMREKHNFDATLRMYKFRLSHWGFRKYMSMEERLAVTRQDYLDRRIIQLPVHHGRELGSKRLKSQVRRTNNNVIRIMKPPDSLHTTEAMLYAVMNYTNGAFDCGLWNLAAFSDTDYSKNETAAWGKEIRNAGSGLRRKHDLALHFRLLGNSCAQFTKTICRKQDPLLVMSAYLGILTLYKWVEKDIALSFAKYLAGITEIQLGKHHPLALFLEKILALGLDKAFEAADVIFNGLFDVLRERVGPGNPLVVQSRIMVVQLLNNLGLIPMGACLTSLESAVSEFRESASNDTMLSSYYTNWARSLLAAALAYDRQYTRASTILDQVADWHQNGGLAYNDKLLVDHLSVRSEIEEACGRYDKAEEYLKQQFQVATEQYNNGRGSHYGYGLVHNRLEKFYRTRNNDEAADEIASLYSAFQRARLEDSGVKE